MYMPGLEEVPQNELPIIFERPGGKFIKFTARPVPTFEPFKELCPEKTPSWSLTASGEKKYDTESKEYKAYREDRNRKFNDWLVIHSITDASNITWEKVNFSDPDTFKFWEDEMIAIGVGAGERSRIKNVVEEVNSISENAVSKAFAAFLVGMQERLAELKEESSRLAERANMLSTDPANDSESSLPAPEEVGTEAQETFK